MGKEVHLSFETLAAIFSQPSAVALPLPAIDAQQESYGDIASRI